MSTYIRTRHSYLISHISYLIAHRSYLISPKNILVKKLYNHSSVIFVRHFKKSPAVLRFNDNVHQELFNHHSIRGNRASGK